jgi:hypothetical protein
VGRKINGASGNKGRGKIDVVEMVLSDVMWGWGGVRDRQN